MSRPLSQEIPMLTPEQITRVRALLDSLAARVGDNPDAKTALAAAEDLLADNVRLTRELATKAEVAAINKRQVATLFEDVEKLTARLTAAELVCKLFGGLGVSNTELGKATSQAWSQWNKAYGSPAWGPEWDRRIAELAAERDRIRAETLERLRSEPRPSEIEIRLPSVVEPVGAGDLAREALTIAEATFPAQAETVLADLKAFGSNEDDACPACGGFDGEHARRGCDGQIDKSSVHTQPEGEPSGKKDRCDRTACEACGFTNDTHENPYCKGGDDAELIAVERRFPMHSPVRYQPVLGQNVFEEHTVRSEPWRLGHGTVVLSLSGRSGGHAVSHLTPVVDGEVTS